MSNSRSINPEFVERYQLELNKNPRSRVFAPLSEAYRKMGLLEEARRICRFGTQANPDFAGGHVAYSKILLEMKAPADALKHLEAAAKLSPDNLLAHTLLGETLIELRKPKEALKAFKMVLFLDPDNERATQAVRKWEFLTADEYGEDVFTMKPLFDKKDAVEAESEIDNELQDLLTESGHPSSGNVSDMRMDLQRRHQRALERALSLADAFTVRNDLHAAVKVIVDAERLLGPMPDLESRARLLRKRLEVLSESDDADDSDESGDDEHEIDDASDAYRIDTSDYLELPDDPDAAPPLAATRKREVLESLLRRISARRSPA